MRRRIRSVNNRHGIGSEYESQKRLTEYIDTNHPDVLWSASAGGARTSISEAKRIKATGYKRGFPDVFIYEPRGPYHGLSIEMKKDKGGVVSKHQKQWKEDLIRRSYKATIARGFDAAVEILEDHQRDWDTNGFPIIPNSQLSLFSEEYTPQSIHNKPQKTSLLD